MRKKPLTQDEAVRWVWYNQSEWGRQRKHKIRLFCAFVGAGAVIGTLLGLFVR